MWKSDKMVKLSSHISDCVKLRKSELESAWTAFKNEDVTKAYIHFDNAKRIRKQIIDLVDELEELLY